MHTVLDRRISVRPFQAPVEQFDDVLNGDILRLQILDGRKNDCNKSFLAVVLRLESVQTAEVLTRWTSHKKIDRPWFGEHVVLILKHTFEKKTRIHRDEVFC